MNSEPYLQRLTARLLEGVDRLPEDFRERHASWIRSRQNPDGGWSGREGESDLYYTGFALRALAVLQGLTQELCEGSGKFLSRKMTGSGSVIDLFSMLVGGFLVRLGGVDVFAATSESWPDRVVESLLTCRKPDGGFAKAPDAISGSTYHSFLVALTFELLDRPIPQLDELVRFVRSRRRDDGGYVEIAPMRRSGTNPTAAGIGILQIANALDEEAKSSVIDFLAELPSPFEGGIRANDRIPAADLLSTFTGSWTMAQLGGLDRLDTNGVREYAESLEMPEGGFRGGLWDDGIDVEYTFYGIGTLGLLAE